MSASNDLVLSMGTAFRGAMDIIRDGMSKKEKLALILFIMLLILTAGELDVEALRPFGRG